MQKNNFLTLLAACLSLFAWSPASAADVSSAANTPAAAFIQAASGIAAQAQGAAPPPQKAAPKAPGNVNAVTVEALVKAETEALATGRSSAGSGAASAAPKKAAPQAMKAEVLSIFGSSLNPSVDIISGAAIYRGVRPGDSINSCKVEEIRDRCVYFEPKGRTPASMCPTACWTGIRLLADPAPGTSVGAPMPAPMPIEQRAIPPPGSRAALKGLNG